jgi:AcrR family transcriptional regulator
MSDSDPPQRRRNAAATRQAILESARKSFARAGYDGAGLREIARGAGVTAMLVNRYFGSKEQLFAEVAGEAVRARVLMTPENLNAPDVAAAVAKTLVEETTPGATALEGMLMMLHSASSPKVAHVGDEWIQLGRRRMLEAGILGSDMEVERAWVFMALIAGLQAVRQIGRTPELVDADPAALERVLTSVIRVLMSEGEKPA